MGGGGGGGDGGGGWRTGEGGDRRLVDWLDTLV